MKLPENMTLGVKGLVTTGMLALLVGCGGGGSSSSDSTADATEILTQGAIQRFGSVYVNDVRYVRSSNGQVLDDDNPSAGEDSLRIGMTVKLRGRINDDGTGTYDTIEVDNELKGPIEAGSMTVDPANPRVGSFSVMGTTVLSSETTYFDESGSGSTVNSLLDLDDASGFEDVVEVSGLFNEAGELEALRIEKKAEDLATYLAAGRKLEVKGTVQSAAGGQLTYASGLVVDYSGAEIDDDMPGNPADWQGLYVESKCDPESPNFNVSNGCFDGATLLATKVDNEVPEVGAGYRAEFEGIIGGFTSIDDIFKVGLVPVDAADAILICGNVTLGDGVKVKVHGDVIDANGVPTVDASSVECRQAKTVRLEGRLTADSDGVTLNLNGVTVVTNDKTEKDDLASIGDLNELDAVAVRGFVDGSGDVIAVRVELEDEIDSDDFIVQAPQDQVGTVNQGADSFELLGVKISTALLQNDDYEGLNDLPIGRDAFYDALINGGAPAFKAKGSYDSGTNTLTAREVELEDND